MVLVFATNSNAQIIDTSFFDINNNLLTSKKDADSYIINVKKSDTVLAKFYDFFTNKIQSERKFIKLKKGRKKLFYKEFYRNGNLFYHEFYSSKPNVSSMILESNTDSLYSYFKNGKLKRIEYFDEYLTHKNTCFDSTGNKIAFVSFYKSPTFPGGDDGLMQYLSENIDYPKKDARKNIEGTVYVNFSVCTDGQLCDFEIAQGVSKRIDAEVLKELKRMPKWQAGTLDGKKKKVIYTLPVLFELVD